MVKVIDYYGQFRRREITCERCGWSGLGAEMKTGSKFGDGLDKHCRKCGERYGFVQFSKVLADDSTGGS